MKISTDALSDKIDAALRLRVGHGKTYSFEALEEVTGIKTRTLRSYVEGGTPSAAGLLSLFAALGPGFTSDILSMISQSARKGDDNEPEHMPTLCAATAFSSLLADALTDGHVDHREAAGLRPIAVELMELLAPIAAGGKPTVVRNGGAA
ncbi:hypothetical protein WNY61_03405 [Sulfitobacter sp. AS92]|uniref:hypothetical protein n=1 Tax=Sulfitobacter sp. AS92 TaxID=3135783 RepID=UPI00317DAAFD